MRYTVVERIRTSGMRYIILEDEKHVIATLVSKSVAEEAARLLNEKEAESKN